MSAAHRRIAVCDCRNVGGVGNTPNGLMSVLEQSTAHDVMPFPNEEAAVPVPFFFLEGLEPASSVNDAVALPAL